MRNRKSAALVISSITQNKKMAALIILSIAAVISLVYGIITPPAAKRGALPKETAAEQSADRPDKKKAAPAERYAQKTDFDDWGRNPFMPKGVSARFQGGLALNGIVWDNISPKAIINGEIVGIGDTIGGYKIVDITPNKTVVNNGSADTTLTLEQ